MLYALWDLGLKIGHSTPLARRDGPPGQGRPARSAPRCSRRATSGATSALYDEARAPLQGGGAARHRARVHRRQAGRARRAPHADGRQPLRRRAQPQGGQGRPARSPHAVLDRQIRLRRPRVARAGRQRAVHPAPNTAASTAPTISCGRCAATSTSIAGPRRGAADLRRPARDRRADALRRPARASPRSSASCSIISCTRRRSAT